jgi:HK97 family phage portal protein
MLSALLGGPVAQAQQTSGTSDPTPWLMSVLGNSMTATGLRIGPAEAMAVPGFAAIIHTLSDDMAAHPLMLYRRTKDGGRERATDHPLYRILKDRPAPWLTSYAWRKAMFMNALVVGNGYSLPRRDPFGVVQRITPMKRGAVTHKWADDGEPFYDVRRTGRGELRGLTYQEVLHHHYRGSTDAGENGGIYGVSPISTHKEAIGLAVAAELFAARFFRNGARPSAVVETDKVFPSDEVAARTRRQVEEVLSGVDNAGKVAIFELGLKLKQWSSNNNDAQLVELRKQQAVEMCTIFRMPPHKIGILDRATFSNIEHQSISYRGDCLVPLAAMSEQEMENCLLSEREQEEYFIEYDLDGTLRGDLLSRYRAYAIGRQWGWLSADDINQLENRNALPDGQGKIYLSPSNMVPASENTANVSDGSGQDSEDQPTPADDGPDHSRNRQQGG